MKSKIDDLKYEYTFTLVFPSVAKDELPDFVPVLEKAVFDATASFPAVTEYFVTPNFEFGEIRFGFRFSGVEAEDIDQMAERLIEDAVEDMGDWQKADLEPPVREESLLVPA